MITQPTLGAQHADGFVDFYALIGASTDLGADELREHINARYKEAQTDRDHRTPARRQEAGLQLELLPQARTVLLDAKRRRRYDAYRQAVEMQSPRMAFEEFLPSLLRDLETVAPNADILSRASLNDSSDSSSDAAPATARSFALIFPSFTTPALICGIVTLFGLSAALPTLAAVPLVVGAPLSLLSAFVVTHTLSQVGEIEGSQA